MNALFKKLFVGGNSGDHFPPEAYSYDSPIDPKEIEAIRKRAAEDLKGKKLYSIERIEDDFKR